MNAAYLVGSKVRLRAMEPEDLDLLYTMENNPQTWDISNISVPYSRYVLKQYIADANSDMYADQQLRLIIERCVDGEAMGTIDMTDFSPMHSRAEVGVVIRSQYRGYGYATEALQLLIEYAFRFLHLHQLTARVMVNNESSLRLFRSAGFESCGLLREWWRVEDSYVDVELLQLISPR